MTAKAKMQEIINDYHCGDSYGEGCDLDCKECRKAFERRLRLLLALYKQEILSGETDSITGETNRTAESLPK